MNTARGNGLIENDAGEVVAMFHFTLRPFGEGSEVTWIDSPVADHQWRDAVGESPIAVLGRLLKEHGIHLSPQQPKRWWQR